MTIKELKDDLCMTVISYFKEYDPDTWKIYSTLTMYINDEDIVSYVVFIVLRKGFDQMCKIGIETKNLESLHKLITTELDNNNRQIDVII